MIYYFVRWLLNFIRYIYLPVIIEGQENIPSEEAFILACNHSSYLDSILIGLIINRRLNFMAKDTLFRNKSLAWLLSQLGAYPVKRESGDIRSIRETLKKLERKCPVVIFPQGTRKGFSQESQLKRGLGLIAFKSKTPVIPVYISGTEKVLPKGSKIIYRHPVHVCIGSPIYFNSQWSYPEVCQIINQAICAFWKQPE